MFLKKKNCLKILLVLVLAALGICAASASSQYFSHRAELAKWTPERAIMEAHKDIQAGSIKIYLHGSFAANTVGVEEEQRSLIENLPRAEAGVGCVIEDMEVFGAQREYAIRYNKAVVQYLQRRTKTTESQSRPSLR